MLQSPVPPNSRSEGLTIFPLLRSLDAAARDDLAARCIPCRYRRDQWIARPSEIGADVFFIQSGVARLQMMRSLDREVIFKDFQAGDFFGGVSAIHGQPRTAGILALTDVMARRMPGAVFRELLHGYPDICDQFLLRMASEIQRLTTRVTEFSTLDVRHRLYAELLRLSRPRQGNGQDNGQAGAPTIACGAVISPPPRQLDIAARIGSRREPVAREMKALERAGLLKRSRGALDIVDVRRLKDMIEEENGAG